MEFRGTLSGSRQKPYVSKKSGAEVMEFFFGVYDETVGNVEVKYDPERLKLPAKGSDVVVRIDSADVWNFGKEIRYHALDLSVIPPAGIPIAGSAAYVAAAGASKK